MELRDATQAILHSSTPAVLIRLADRYIENFNNSPRFVLPREHVILRPIIEVFHDDLGGFVSYVKAIRNVLTGLHKSDVHAVYRTIYTRYVQHVRRKRAERALASIERMLERSLDADEKIRVVKKLEQHWGARRTNLLKHARDGYSMNHLPIEVRSSLLADFWAQVDKEIDEGDLPMFKF